MNQYVKFQICVNIPGIHAENQETQRMGLINLKIIRKLPTFK